MPASSSIASAASARHGAAASAPAVSEPVRVRGCTCFRVRRLARRVTQVYDHALAPCGLRVTQFSLLSQLIDHDGLPMHALADALDMDRTTLTRNLKPLLAAGLVVLAASVDDARVRTVGLTAAGRARHADAKRLWRQAQDTVNRTLGHGEVASLHALVDGLIATFNGHAA